MNTEFGISVRGWKNRNQEGYSSTPRCKIEGVVGINGVGGKFHHKSFNCIQSETMIYHLVQC